MAKEKEVINIFMLFDKLKHLERSGWKQKGISRFRVESVADHIFGCQMLAYAMYSEFDYEIDIDKVILLLTVHEIGETIIGDLTPEDMLGVEKSKYEEEAVLELLKLIPNSDLLKALFFEFENRETKEAKFAYQIDKAECDLQANLYDQDGSYSHKYEGYEFSNNWISYDRKRIDFDKNFDLLLAYIIDNEMVATGQSNNKIQNVISFYVNANKLKDVQREGEKIWNVKPERFGSIAEHILSTQILAIAIYLVYKVNIDIKRVNSMLSVHEIGEIIFGDKSTLLKEKSDDNEEFKCALEVISILTSGENIADRLKEFNNKETKESIFCKYCDKLAPDIVSKIYDQLNLIDLNDQGNNKLINNPIVKKYIENYDSFSTMWILFGQDTYKYPEPFISISNYILKNNIEDFYSKRLKKIYKGNI